MEKIAITSTYQEQFGSLLVRQVRDMVMIDEDDWARRRDPNEHPSPSETVLPEKYKKNSGESLDINISTWVP